MSKSVLAVAAFAVALAACRLGVAQDPPPAAPAPVSSPEALAILAGAIAHQAPEALTVEGAIRDFSVKLQAEVWDYSKDAPEKQALGVNRFLTMDPEQFRSEWITTGGTDVYGFDGRRYWFAEYTPGGLLVEGESNPRILGGDKYLEDRQRIQDEVAETRYLLRFFFLANLRGPEVTFTLEPDETIDHFGKSRAVRVLRRENHAPDTSEPPLTIWIDVETKALLRAKAHATKEGAKSLTFSFRYDERVQPRVKGVLFPFRIEIREQAFGAESDRLASRATVLPDGIDFNSGLTPEVFRPKGR